MTCTDKKKMKSNNQTGMFFFQDQHYFGHETRAIGRPVTSALKHTFSGKAQDTKAACIRVRTAWSYLIQITTVKKSHRLQQKNDVKQQKKGQSLVACVLTAAASFRDPSSQRRRAQSAPLQAKTVLSEPRANYSLLVLQVDGEVFPSLSLSFPCRTP